MPADRQLSDNIKRLYAHHAHFYDWTRPFFLFGRRELVKKLPLREIDSQTPIIREIGCGTGTNLRNLIQRIDCDDVLKKRRWRIEGIDLSPAMLKKAKRKLRTPPSWCDLRLIEATFEETAPQLQSKADGVILSYVWSMMPGTAESLHPIKAGLKENGWIAVVDFFNSPHPLFHKWLAHHHVFIGRERIAPLTSLLDVNSLEVRAAFLGLWDYFIAFGRA